MRALSFALLAALAIVSTAALATRAEAYTQSGIASYYSSPQMTASGERFNPGAMTAAHKSLPMGTRVQVTHVKSGRSVIVRINDRGPFVKGRIIDLSRAAAGQLGISGAGLGQVRVTVLSGGGKKGSKAVRTAHAKSKGKAIRVASRSKRRTVVGSRKKTRPVVIAAATLKGAKAFNALR